MTISTEMSNKKWTVNSKSHHLEMICRDCLQKQTVERPKISTFKRNSWNEKN